MWVLRGLRLKKRLAFIYSTIHAAPPTCMPSKEAIAYKLIQLLYSNSREICEYLCRASSDLITFLDFTYFYTTSLNSFITLRKFDDLSDSPSTGPAAQGGLWQPLLTIPLTALMKLLPSCMPPSTNFFSSVM